MYHTWPITSFLDRYDKSDRNILNSVSLSRLEIKVKREIPLSRSPMMV
jgi:hypothetical protein